MKTKELDIDTVRSNNKIVSTFMGLDYDSDVYHTCTNHLYESGHRDRDFIENDLNWLCYHSSMDWLFPVLTKIKSMTIPAPRNMNKNHVITTYKMGETLGCWCEITYTLRKLSEWKDRHASIPCDVKNITTQGQTLVEAVYRAVVEFIIWYNENIIGKIV